MFQRPISPHLSPNAERRDVWFVFRHILNPVRWLTWIRGSWVDTLNQQWKSRFHVGFAQSFDSGRTALFAVLKALELQPGDLVVTQAFTCVVVPNAIIAAGALPLYVDIDDMYNIDVSALENELARHQNIRAVIVQHTFGVPADVRRIRELCSRYHVRLIEDCAHALGATVEGVEVGRFGDAAIFSFGRDKVISSVSGGVALTSDPGIGERLNRFWLGLRYPSLYWIFQRLNHPLVFWKGQLLYYVGSLGKVIIRSAQWLNLVSMVLSPLEKKGMQRESLRLPNVLARWSLDQLERLPRFTQHRLWCAKQYEQAFAELPQITTRISTERVGVQFLRYTIEVEDPTSLFTFAKERGVLLGDWYTTVIGPADCSLESVGYVRGSCPAAEKASCHVVNLPTSISTRQKDVEYVIQCIRDYYAQRIVQ